MTEVTLNREDAFLIIKETLTRIGVTGVANNKLYQSCHIFHKAGKYYISHFKLMFEVDGKRSNIDDGDLNRQETIANMLQKWNLVSIVNKNPQSFIPSLVKVVPKVDLKNWELVPMHRIGSK